MGLFDDSEKFAAIDIGSNGFHLAIAEPQGDKLKKLASMSEKVQLASGLNPHGELSKDVQIRGLDCLSRFVGRISDIRSDRLRVVATNALRQAVNGDEFIRHANAILPVPIEVISGREEARLVYLGVAHTNPSKAQRLVIDIGGGSSELIIGKGLTPFLKEYYGVGKIIKETDKGKCIIKDGILNGVEPVRFSEIFGSYVLYEGKKYFIR